MLSTVNVRLAAIPVSALLALSAAGCGNDSEAEPQRPATDSAASVGASASASAAPAADSEYDTTLQVAKPNVSQAALDKYGATEVDKATNLVANIVDEYGYNDTLLFSKAGQNKSRVLSATKSMTPAAAEDWRRAVADFTSGDAQRVERASSTIYSYSLYAGSDGSNGYYNPVSGPGAVNKTIRSMRVEIAQDGRLLVRADTFADLRVIKKDTPTAPGTNLLGRWLRDTTYHLVKVDSAWKVDQWTSNMSVGDFVADK